MVSVNITIQRPRDIKFLEDIQSSYTMNVVGEENNEKEMVDGLRAEYKKYISFSDLSDGAKTAKKSDADNLPLSRSLLKDMLDSGIAKLN